MDARRWPVREKRLLTVHVIVSLLKPGGDCGMDSEEC